MMVFFFAGIVIASGSVFLLGCLERIWELLDPPAEVEEVRINNGHTH